GPRLCYGLQRCAVEVLVGDTLLQGYKLRGGGGKITRSYCLFVLVDRLITRSANQIFGSNRGLLRGPCRSIPDRLVREVLLLCRSNSVVANCSLGYSGQVIAERAIRDKAVTGKQRPVYEFRLRVKSPSV